LENASLQAKRASDVVARLRGFLYRGETTPTPTTAQTLVIDSLALLRTDVALNRIEISSTLEPQPAPILVDAVQMQQVIINAVRNAIEAMAEAATQRRRIDIVQKTVGGFVEIAVADSGPGLAPDIADRAFEPFVTTKPSGMGLGLAISRSIVEAHGGTLRFAPVKNGAMLVISIPRAENAHG
jgi:two-component system sensor kinase FixL